MKNRKIGILSFVGAAVAGMLCMAAPASASSLQYDFSNNIGNNTSYSGAEFTMTVNDLGGNLVSFVFHNNGPAGSAITGIYFYDGVILGNTGSIDNSTISGNFVENSGSPANLPGGNPYGLTNATKEFYSHSQGINGIAAGEYLTITMEIQGTFQDLQNAIESAQGLSQSNPFQSGMLVVGLHVQGLPGSDQYLNSTTIIPLPAAVWMGLAGIMGVVAVRRRFA